VRFRLVNRFDASVRNLFPIECQKYRTRWAPLPVNREPKTTSARPDSSGASTTPYSAGSYSRSASCTITYGNVASSKPRRSAAPLPRLNGCSNTRTRGSASPRRICRVPSVEPSSTISTSPVYGERSTWETTSSTVARSL
jgi:hypothetical protein